MKTKNAMIIAGYDVLADKIPAHIQYIESCYERAQKENIDAIITLGGATNPDYPYLTEARANFNILINLRSEIALYPLSDGNTSTETLESAKTFFKEANKFEEANKITKTKIDKMIICAEQSRLSGFLMDALMVGLLDLANETIAVGIPFPESKENFDSERKKILSKILSHKSRVFRRLRNARTKIHQLKVAAKKRKK